MFRDNQNLKLAVLLCPDPPLQEGEHLRRKQRVEKQSSVKLPRENQLKEKPKERQLKKAPQLGKEKVVEEGGER